MKQALLILVLALGGCAGNAPVTPSSRLVPPPAWAMEAATPLPVPQKDEDAKTLLGQCRGALAMETSKLMPLQSFVTRVTKSQQ